MLEKTDGVNVNRERLKGENLCVICVSVTVPKHLCHGCIFRLCKRWNVAYGIAEKTVLCNSDMCNTVRKFEPVSLMWSLEKHSGQLFTQLLCNQNVCVRAYMYVCMYVWERLTENITLMCMFLIDVCVLVF